jgi:dihydroflavonol-4-reductase
MHTTVKSKNTMSDHQKKIFVTGGAGFIGSRVVELLLNEGYEVRCLLRSTTNTKRIDHLTYEKALGDITDPESIKNGMQGCTGVIHLASFSNWEDIHSPRMESVVVEGSKNVLAAAKAAGNLPMVYVSSSTAVNGTKTPEVLNEDAEFTMDQKVYSYGYAKKRVEGFCKQAAKEGLPVKIVNPAEVYGPNDFDKITSGNLIDFAKSSPVLVCKGGTSVVHVDDVAAGVVAALDKGRPGERYFLGGDNISIYDLAEKTLKILDQKKKIMTLPNGLISFLAWLGSTFKIPMPFNPAVIPYAIRYWYADNSKAKKELGVTFRSAEQTLEPTLKWLVQEKMI